MEKMESESLSDPVTESLAMSLIYSRRQPKMNLICLCGWVMLLMLTHRISSSEVCHPSMSLSVLSGLKMLQATTLSQNNQRLSASGMIMTMVATMLDAASSLKTRIGTCFQTLQVSQVILRDELRRVRLSIKTTSLLRVTKQSKSSYLTIVTLAMMIVFGMDLAMCFNSELRKVWLRRCTR